MHSGNRVGFAFDVALFGEAELPKNGVEIDQGIELSGLPSKDLLSVFGPPTFKSAFSDVDILHCHYKRNRENLQEIKVSLSFGKTSNQIKKRIWICQTVICNSILNVKKNK